MININETATQNYDMIGNNVVLISKIHQSFEALEEALGLLKLEEPLFLTYIAQKAFAKAVCQNIQDSTEEYKIN